jgi:hypothetical protein
LSIGGKGGRRKAHELVEAYSSEESVKRLLFSMRED